MKIIYTILLLLNLTIISKGQTWQCFPENQKSYYQFDGFEGLSIDFVTQDSTVINGSETTLYFKRKIQIPGDSDCTSVLRAYYFNMNYGSLVLDSLTLKFDTVVFNYSSLCYFLPNAYVGQSWTMHTFGTITITCDSIIAENIFGSSDSVKYYHTTGAINGKIIRLSKTFGFIDYIPFIYLCNNWSFAMMHLIGASNTNGQYGFQSPQFLDYLPYHAGDLLKWDLFIDGSSTWSPSYHFTFYDSITQVISFTDSMIINYDRIAVDSGNNISNQPGQTRKFTRDDFGGLLDAVPNDLGLGPGETGIIGAKGIYNNSYLFPLPDTVQVDTSISRGFRWTHFDFDLSTCTVYEILDGVAPEYIFNTHLGLTNENLYGQSTVLYTTLVDARLNGITYGDPNFTLGVEKLNLVNYELYPNPTTGHITISLTGKQSDIKVIVTNSFGQEIPIDENYNGSFIDFDIKANKGLYFIKINSNGKSSVFKVVKI
jgi:hypothetical protein